MLRPASRWQPSLSVVQMLPIQSLFFFQKVNSTLPSFASTCKPHWPPQGEKKNYCRDFSLIEIRQYVHLSNKILQQVQHKCGFKEGGRVKEHSFFFFLISQLVQYLPEKGSENGKQWIKEWCKEKKIWISIWIKLCQYSVRACCYKTLGPKPKWNYMRPAVLKHKCWGKTNAWVPLWQILVQALF